MQSQLFQRAQKVFSLLESEGIDRYEAIAVLDVVRIMFRPSVTEKMPSLSHPASEESLGECPLSA